MASSIQPLSSVSPQAVKEYLVSQGQAKDVVDWKYFDPAFGTGCERGYVYIQNDKIAGFLGLIPFQTNHSASAKCAWSCDWFRDEAAPGTMAIMLIKATLRSYDLIYSLGGSEKTKAILPRLARTTVENAGVVLHKPLRLGGVARPLIQHFGLPAPKFLSLLNVIPVARVRTVRVSSGARIQNGLDDHLASVSNNNVFGGSFSEYGSDYIQWQVGRCPLIVTYTYTVPAREQTKAAVVFWRHVKSTEYWRLAIFPQYGALGELEIALDNVIRYIYKQGGAVISLLLSHLQTDLLQLLKAKGFAMAKKRLPLYLISRHPNPQAGELQGLSYLDTDLAYRFHAVTGD